MTSDKKSSPGNPFARLAGLRDQLPPGAAPAGDEPEPAPGEATPEARGPARAVVRYQRAGRRGKEATLVEKLGLEPAGLESWCKALKQALGCGGTVDRDVVVLQGDQRARLPALLTARGVRKVTVS